MKHTKRLFSLVLAVALLLGVSAIALALTVNDVDDYTCYARTNDACMYASPDIKSAVVIQPGAGKKVTVIGEAEGGMWVEVSMEKTYLDASGNQVTVTYTGYMPAKSLTKEYRPFSSWQAQSPSTPATAQPD